MKNFFLILLVCFVSYSLTAQTKTVYLLRHGKSSHNDKSLTDPQRPLADRGHADAQKVAKRINGQMEKPDMIISSIAFRAKQTAKYFCEELNFEYDSVRWSSALYRCSPDKILNIIANLDEANESILILAHNPAISSCAAYLQKEIKFKDYPTAGIIAIEFDVDTWKEVPRSKGKILFYEYPKKKVGD